MFCCELERLGKIEVLLIKSIKETENWIFFFSVRSKFIPLLKTKSCIFTCGYATHENPALGVYYVKVDLTLKKIKYPLRHMFIYFTKIVFLRLCYYYVSQDSHGKWIEMGNVTLKGILTVYVVACFCGILFH